MGFTKNNLRWDRLSYHNLVITFGEHYESLTDSERSCTLRTSTPTTRGTGRASPVLDYST